jgi:hypothetical protein
MSLYTIRRVDGSQVGPIGIEQLRDLAKKGEIPPNNMIFVQGENRWYLATALPEIGDIIKQRRGKIARAPLPKSLSDTRRKSGVTSKSESKNLPAAPKQKKGSLPQGETYTIRTGDGVEHEGLNFAEVKELVKGGKVKATTMIFTRSSKLWHLAASIREVRALLRRYNPDQNSILNRIRSMGIHSRDSANAGPDPDGSMLRVKKPFWKKLFPGED